MAQHDQVSGGQLADPASGCVSTPLPANWGTPPAWRVRLGEPAWGSHSSSAFDCQALLRCMKWCVSPPRAQSDWRRKTAW